MISTQLLRSGTAIGALVVEANQAESRANFVLKFSMAKKEAHETRYLLRLMKDTELMITREIEILFKELDELIKLLVASNKTAKTK